MTVGEETPDGSADSGRLRADRPWYRRTPVLYGTVGLVLVIGVALLGFAELGGYGKPFEMPSPAGTPAPMAVREGGAPTNVKVRRAGEKAWITWTDNTGGKAAQTVNGGVSGRPARQYASLRPGVTQAYVVGLGGRQQYCFTVLAVLSPSRVVSSAPGCTKGAAPAKPSKPTAPPSSRPEPSPEPTVSIRSPKPAPKPTQTKKAPATAPPDYPYFSYSCCGPP